MIVALSIVEYNTKDLLRDCLKTIFSQKWQNQVEIWVTDNASKDDSILMVKKEFPEVKLIESKKNLGFGAGHNLVFKKANADYFLILNSDTKMGAGVIDEMVAFLEKNPDCAIASCKILGFDGHLQPNGGDLPFGLALFSWLFNLELFGFKKASFHRNDKSYYQNAHKVGWVSGNFMMIKKEVLKKIGFFNEDYFMYFEDVEFCYRAKKAGFEVWVNPNVNILHLSGGSQDDPKLRQWSGEFRGLILFYTKQFGVVTGLLIRLLVYISIVLRGIAFALIGKLSYTKTYAKVITTI